MMSTRSSSRCFAVAASTLALALGLYAVSPVVTLMSVGAALQHDDLATLSASLDWHDVRSGLKADLGPGAPVSLASTHQVVAASDELPDFGDSFATTIVSHVVDDVVTPEHLVAMLSHATSSHASARPAPAAGLASMLAHVQHIGFVGPTRFEAAIRLTDDGDAPPVLISLQVQKWQWKIVRIRLPDQLLNGGSNNRT